MLLFLFFLFHLLLYKPHPVGHTHSYAFIYADFIQYF